MIASVDDEHTPLRLVLGSDAHRFITTALRERLAEIEPQAEAAASTDWQA